MSHARAVLLPLLPLRCWAPLIAASVLLGTGLLSSALTGCAPLPRFEAGECGNHVLEEEVEDWARRSVELGWTQIQTAGGSFGEVELLKKLYGEGKIKLRVYEAIRGPGPDAQRLLREGPNVGLYDLRRTIRTIKVSID